MKKKTLKEVVKEQLYWSDTENSPFHWDQGTGNPYDLINNFNDFAPDLHFGGDHFSPYMESTDGHELPMCLFYQGTFGSGGLTGAIQNLQLYKNICNGIGNSPGQMADSIGQTIACCEELNTAYGGIDITNLDSVAAGDAVQGTGGFTNMSAADYISPEQEFSDPVSTGMPTFTPQEPIEPVEPVDIKAHADNLEEAIEYFSKMKQLPKEEFLKLFMVTKIK
jgi:hypothetical protein